MIKQNVNKMLLGASFILGLAITAKAQETQENPLDTLARSVNQMADDLNKLKRLKITGYIQPQWQHIDSAGAQSASGGNFAPYINNRFMMRRGRFKFTYEYKNTLVMINTDVTEKGLFMRETYLKITDPKWKIFSVAFGLMQDQFGFELTQSSSERETPERARFTQTLFPTERDLGVFGSIKVPNTSLLSGLKFDAAIINGSASVTSEFDSHKDYSARLSYNKTSKSEKFQFGVGASYYTGGYRQGRKVEYNTGTNTTGEYGFVKSSDTANFEHVALRQYIGGDIQFTIDWAIGLTTIRAEYVVGDQPGTSTSSNSASAAPTSDIFHRKFEGAYFYFIQDIGESKFQVVAKYDWYDPNTEVSGNQIGVSNSNTKSGDIKYTTIGTGLTYRYSGNVKLMLYYDMVTNETTKLAGYTKDLKDNVFTCRVQYKF